MQQLSGALLNAADFTYCGSYLLNAAALLNAVAIYLMQQLSGALLNAADFTYCGSYLLNAAAFT